MKCKILIPALLLFFYSLLSPVLAKPSLARMTNIHVNSSGSLITPDKYHHREALRYYNDDKGTALKKFKFSAEFGGVQSMKFIALMYLDGDGIPKNLILGQAWLKLAAKNGESESVALWDQLKSENKEGEMALINNEYDKLLASYGSAVVMNNVYKFYRRFKFQTLGKPNVIKFQGNNAVLNELQITRLSTQIKEFYYEKKDKVGKVKQGEIITKDE